MRTTTIAQKIEQSIHAYFDACRLLDADAIAACFAPAAVHYLPHLAPLQGGATIGAALAQDLRNRGGAYFIDRLLVDADRCAAGVEWSRTFAQDDRILRGFEYCEFDPASVLMREIRGYYAAAPHPTTARHELVGFDYAGRKYRAVS